MSEIEVKKNLKKAYKLRDDIVIKDTGSLALALMAGQGIVASEEFFNANVPENLKVAFVEIQLQFPDEAEDTPPLTTEEQIAEANALIPPAEGIETPAAEPTEVPAITPPAEGEAAAPDQTEAQAPAGEPQPQTTE